MNLWRLTQHSWNGIAPGEEDFRVYAGPPFAEPSFLVERGNYLQTIDEIVDMGRGTLVFSEGAFENREKTRQDLIERARDYD